MVLEVEALLLDLVVGQEVFFAGGQSANWPVDEGLAAEVEGLSTYYLT